MTIGSGSALYFLGLLAFGGLMLEYPPVDSLPAKGGGKRHDPRIAFGAKRDGNWDIYVVRASGGEPVRLTSRQEPERFPVWSPDGSRISFASEGVGNRWELWVMDSTGGNMTRLASDVVLKG